MSVSTEKEWIDQLDENYRAFKENFGELTQEQLNWKPDAKSWSIAENIHHLITINESYFPIFEQLHEGIFRVPFAGKFGLLVRMFGNMIFKSVQPDRNKKMKTFDMWEPNVSQVDETIFADFAKNHEQLKHHIENCRESIEENTVIHSPANRKIVYTLPKALDIIVSHEQRHLEQSKEVLKSMKKKAVA